MTISSGQEGTPASIAARLDTLNAHLHDTVSSEFAVEHHYEIAQEAIAIARKLVAVRGSALSAEPLLEKLAAEIARAREGVSQAQTALTNGSVALKVEAKLLIDAQTALRAGEAGTAPEGPWAIVETADEKRHYVTDNPVFARFGPFTQAEAIAVRDALNRVASRGAGPQGNERNEK